MKSVPYKLFVIIAIALSQFLTSTCSINKNELIHGGNRERSDIITEKAFYILTLIKEDEVLIDIVRNNPELKSIGYKKADEIITSIGQCKDIPCYSTAIQWDESEIRTIGTQLIYLYQTNTPFRKLVSLSKERGVYKLYEHLTDTAFIRSAWLNTAHGMNNATNIYLNGEKPRYPLIDSISYRVNDVAFKNAFLNASEKIIQKHSNQDGLFFELPLKLTLKALEINGRDEALRYEPLSNGSNKQPFGRIHNINWGKYKYSVILVPGQGPEKPGLSLDPIGKYRLNLAVASFKDGLAPFIVVSGGNVHPYKTPFNEAVEMKKYLIDSLSIPANIIFIEPHARHTTTNLRNTSRMIYRFGIPFQKPVLITTTSNQNSYINERMGQRALNELGYLPYERLKKLEDERSEFYPVINVLQVNPFDILDP